MFKLSRLDILEKFPPALRPYMIKLYEILYPIVNGVKFVIALPRAIYLRRSAINYQKVSDLDADVDVIMHNLDWWVLKQRAIGYVPEDFYPQSSYQHGIQQVRREIAELVQTILSKGLHMCIVEIGLGRNGGTHVLWRQIFNHVVTVEVSASLAMRFRIKEKLDSRSTIIVGKSEDPHTFERVRACTEGVDVLFVDGNHRYESVARDWAIYRTLVKNGGIIAFHDSICQVGRHGTAKFLDDLSRGEIDGKQHIIHTICYSDHVGISYIEC